MRSVRRWLLVAALALAGAWCYVLATSGAQLRMMFDGFDDATTVARAVVDQAPLAPDAATEELAQEVIPEEELPVASATETDGGLLPQQISTDDLSAAQIARLLEDEIASDTDPAAADEFLRAFAESLEAPE